MEHLIANSGIQFITETIQLNPSSQFVMPSGKPLKYTFFDMEQKDPITDEPIHSFEMLCLDKGSNQYFKLNDLLMDDGFLETCPNGTLILDDSGMPIIKEGFQTTFFQGLTESEDGRYSINTIDSFKIKDSMTGSQVPAFTYLLDKWIPMPMFEKEINGQSMNSPVGWCRLKISLLSQDKQGNSTFKLVWAFDTELGHPFDVNDLDSVIDPFPERPIFSDTDPSKKEYSLCNYSGALYSFFIENDEIMGTSTMTNVASYIAQLLGIDVESTQKNRFKFLAFYIYLINVLRLSSNIEVTLHNNVEKIIPVDFVLDIGNSRTCGVLFENGVFENGKMLEIRDLTDPSQSYDSSFDMRVVFRRADIGNDIITKDPDLFSWKSILRVGREAENLIYKALNANDGMSEKTTNYSSPKRFLWDNKPFSGKWEFLVSSDDPTNVRIMSGSVSIPGLKKYFDASGNYNPNPSFSSFGSDCKYSRGSLMTHVFLEIFQQATMQINSVDFRRKRGDIDCHRVLRNVIITCPTAMSNMEQMKLRQCACDAVSALKRVSSAYDTVKVTPSPDSIKIRDEFDDMAKPSWAYDEATASQLVYLFAEASQKYNGDIKTFIEMMGHVRKDMAEKYGYDKKSLTIGSIDIGAGTTDLMISAYQYAGDESTQVKPVPLFWDSFYQAGDDILKNIILRVIIEGDSIEGSKQIGSIKSILEARLLDMTDEQLRNLASATKTDAYKGLMAKILDAFDNGERSAAIRTYAENLIKGYFGLDDAGMDFRDKRCRLDFNTQVSLPIARKMLDQLRLKRPSRTFKYEEIFTDNTPADYLLEHFRNHFGFGLEEIEWKYDALAIADQVRATMESLMKQLSIIVGSYDVDILVLSGRPASLDPLTDMFVKYYPLSPDRLIRLNEYQVGKWYPLANPDGYFYDQKSVVAVGAMVGYMASSTGLRGLSIDFSETARLIKSTANYIGVYNSDKYQVTNSFITPKLGNATCIVNGEVAYLGCKQLNAIAYQARPLYAIYNNSNKMYLQVQLTRDYSENRELLVVEEVTDSGGETINSKDIDLVIQSIADSRFWLDDGAFKFL